MTRWIDSDGAKRAILRSEWLIAIPDADYEAHCNARRIGDMESAALALRHGQHVLLDRATALWHQALAAGKCSQTEHDACCARLADRWLWPQEWRELEARAKAALAKEAAA